MGENVRKIEEKEENCVSPNHLTPMRCSNPCRRRQRYEETPNVESRTRYQMVLLAHQEYKVPQIARMVLRSEDTVARVLNRFLTAGLDAVPRRTPPGRERKGHGSVGSRIAARH